ncbi:MAG: hypothetical protein HMLKMBBP_00090 [Planctomycetes bacterium]|nr:hypothetical protein [Planctomycetota bacterium]
MRPSACETRGSTRHGGPGANGHEPLSESDSGTTPDRAAAPSDPFGEPLVNAASVAQFLAVDTSTVYRLAQTGAIPAIKIAHRVLRFRATDVREFLEARMRKAATPGRVKSLLGKARE